MAVRLILTVLCGNLSGYAAFRLAFALTPGLWRAGAGLARPESDFGPRIVLTALTAIAFAAPPVLIGALAARLAGRARPWAGMAAGLWGIGFVWWWPDPIPLLGPGAWLGPAILILLSGLIGGWLIELRAAVNRTASRSGVDHNAPSDQPPGT